MENKNKLSISCTIMTIFLISLLLIGGCAKDSSEDKENIQEDIEKDNSNPIIEETDIQEPSPTPEEIKEEEIKEEVLETANTNESISSIRCTDQDIQAYITNIDDEEIVLGQSVKIIINGIIANPPECEKLKLEPGENTYCRDITGPLYFRKGMNKVQFNFKSKSIVKMVECVNQELRK